jgi:hypothetical protein
VKFPSSLALWSTLALSSTALPASAAYVLYDAGDLTQVELGFVVNPTGVAWDSQVTALVYQVSLDNKGDANPANDTWLYQYTFEVPVKAISHVLIETSPGITLLAGTTVSGREGPTTFSARKNSNPGMPGPLFGLKFNTTLDPLIYSWQIETDRAPMWGDFYAKDGKTGGAEVYAYNINFGLAAPIYVQGVSADGFALVPDTVTGGPAVPVPAALWLFGPALGALTAARRRRAESGSATAGRRTSSVAPSGPATTL